MISAGCGGISPSRRWRGLTWKFKNQVWKEGTNQGKTCLVEKLIADHLVSNEIIRAILVRGWKPSGTPSFKVLGDNMFLVDFVNEIDKKRVLEGRP